MFIIIIIITKDLHFQITLLSETVAPIYLSQEFVKNSLQLN